MRKPASFCFFRRKPIVQKDIGVGSSVTNLLLWVVPIFAFGADLTMQNLPLFTNYDI